MGSNKAAAGVWAAVIEFRLDPRQECDTRSYSVNFWEWRIGRKCIWRLREVFVGCVSLDFICKSSANCEVVFAEAIGYTLINQ